MALDFHLESGEGGVWLRCGWRGKWYWAVMWTLEGGAGGTRLSCGGKDKWH